MTTKAFFSPLDPPTKTVVHRLSDQLAAAHDVLANVRSWMQGQVRFREDHPQWRGLVDNLRTHIARCNEVLESTAMKATEMRVGDKVTAREDFTTSDTNLKVHQSVVMEIVAINTEKESLQCSFEVRGVITVAWFQTYSLRRHVEDPHTKLAAHLTAQAKEAKDDGPPRQQAMAENFKVGFPDRSALTTRPAIGDVVLTELELPGLIGQRKLVTMPALVAALNAEDPTLIGLNVFFPPNSGMPAMGQIWAQHAVEPTLGCWRWSQSHLDLLARLAKLEAPRPAPGPQKPSVGRQVHYVPADAKVGDEVMSATITWVNTDEVGLHVLTRVGTEEKVAEFSETPKPGCWSWPGWVL